MGIVRLVEYGRCCDNEECDQAGMNVAGWFTRQQAEDVAIKDGWVKCTYKRWLCPACARKVRKNESAIGTRSMESMFQL